MFIGDDVSLGQNAILKAITQYPIGAMRHPEGRHKEQTFEPTIVIGNGVTATSHLHIAAVSEITIEDEVMLASNVFICDGLHGYGDADIPYKYQGIFKIAPIRIKRGSWIGQNVVILPGVTIGELSIVGANSVVSKSIPDKCIAAGAPAKVFKTWDASARAWKPVE